MPKKKLMPLRNLPMKTNKKLMKPKNLLKKGGVGMLCRPSELEICDDLVHDKVNKHANIHKSR